MLDKKSEERHDLPITKKKNGKDEEQTKGEHSDVAPSILQGSDKPGVQLDTPEPSPVHNEKRKGSTKITKDKPDTSPKPASSR